jgi:hypothetical protein
MKLKTEMYKGYAIQFAEKILGGNKLVTGSFPSKVTGKVLGSNGGTKDFVLSKCKQMIDREVKVKGMK